MTRKPSASSQRGKLVVRSEADIRAYAKSPAYKRAITRIKAIRDKDIDFSDIPELTDGELDRMVRARAARLRALKRPISIRLEPAVLKWLKREGPGYQTRINELLREAMERSEKRARKAS